MSHGVDESVSALLPNCCSPTVESLTWMFVGCKCTARRDLIHTLISGSAVPPTSLQPSEWKQLHKFTVTVELHEKASIQGITKFLEKFHPPSLQDVTVKFRTVKTKPFIPWNNSYDSDACLRFEAALCKFPRRWLSLLGSSGVHARKRLWVQELGPLFPTLRDGNRLAVESESSERFGHSSSTV